VSTQLSPGFHVGALVPMNGGTVPAMVLISD
jgi:hypothetical protein